MSSWAAPAILPAWETGRYFVQQGQRRPCHTMPSSQSPPFVTTC